MKKIKAWAVIGEKSIFTLRDLGGGLVSGFSVFKTREAAYIWHNTFLCPDIFRIVPVTVEMDIKEGKK